MTNYATCFRALFIIILDWMIKDRTLGGISLPFHALIDIYNEIRSFKEHVLHVYNFSSLGLVTQRGH